MNNLRQDIIRYRMITNSSVLKEPSFIVILFYRLSKRVNKIRIKPLKFFFNLFIIPTYRFLSIFIGISIPRSTQIGPGLVIFHYGAIAINGLTIIGENCTLRQGVTIGNKNKIDDVPILGNNVDIGAGAVIIGNIRIGNNVSIGANAVVLNDVPDNHIAVGIPARNFEKK